MRKSLTSARPRRRWSAISKRVNLGAIRQRYNWDANYRLSWWFIKHITMQLLHSLLPLLHQNKNFFYAQKKSHICINKSSSRECFFFFLQNSAYSPSVYQHFPSKTHRPARCFKWIRFHSSGRAKEIPLKTGLQLERVSLMVISKTQHEDLVASETRENIKIVYALGQHSTTI